MTFNQLLEFFSVAAFLLTLRETMEAALIVSILLAYLTKTQNPEFKRDVWMGTGLAIIISIFLAVVIQFTVGSFGDVVIFGLKFEPLFEGMVMIVASMILTTMIIWMFKHARTIKDELESKVQEALLGTNRRAILGLAFIAVMREGVETVLFLTGVSAAENPTAVLGGVILGMIMAMLLALGLYQGSIQLDLKKFFNITSVLLIFFAAGLLAQGVHEFQELGLLGPVFAPWNSVLWDTSWLLNDGDGGLGSLARSLFGYQDKPSLVEIIFYFGYWIGAGFAFMRINKLPLRKTPITS